jgi:NodT family efflux transporter outer membrane factor (OMF) lipoprotein
MKTVLIISLALLGLLSGCTVGPNYQPPRLDVPAQWTSPPAGGETNLPPTEIAWWKTFHDPEFNSLIERGVRSNLDLRMAGARVREARANRGVVAADYWPSADAAGSYTRERLSSTGFPPFPPGTALNYDIYQAGFDAAWELDVFGGTRRAVEAANAGVSAAEYGRRDVLVSLLGEVGRNYVQARSFQRRLAITRSNIAAQQDILGLTRDRFKAGLTSDLDVRQAETLLATTEAEVPSLETGFKESAHRLGVLLAQPPGALLAELSQEMPIPVAPPEVPVGLPSGLLQRRPDLQRAERELAAATAQIGVAVSDLFPKFSLTGNVGLQSVSAGDWFSSGSRFWSFGPTAQWRLLDAGRIRANIRVQNARQEQALSQYEKTVLGSLEEVENALTAYAQENFRRQALSRAVASSQQALDISSQLYQNGLADYLRVLEAQRSVYQNQDALAQSDAAVALSLVALYKALGGGWEDSPRTAMK